MMAQLPDHTSAKATEPIENDPRQQGFTLVEFLLALSIAVFAMAAMASGLHVLARSWTKNAADLQRQDMLLRGIGIFTRDVRGMRRRSWKNATGQSIAFSGSPQAMRLITLEPPFPTKPGLYVINYRIARSTRGTRLLRERAGFSSELYSFAGLTFADSVALLEGAYRFNFQYGAMRNGRMTWTSSWRDRQRWPNLIRLHIDDQTTGRAAIAPIAVQLRIGAEHECIRPRSRFCSFGPEQTAANGPDPGVAIIAQATGGGRP